MEGGRGKEKEKKNPLSDLNIHTFSPADSMLLMWKFISVSHIPPESYFFFLILRVKVFHSRPNSVGAKFG